jgi:hypothetical protein
MPITLANAQQLSNNKLTNYVIDEFRKSALLDQMLWDNCVKPVGQTMTYSYNRVTTQPTAAPRLINAEYTAQETVTTQISVNLAILGGSFQVDRVLQMYEREVVDNIAFQASQKTKAAMAEWHNQFINGNAGLGTGEFDGLEQLLTGGGQELNLGVIDLDSSADITTNWTLFLDAMRRLRALMDGAPSVYLMNQDMYAVFQSVMDRAGINLASKENYGDEVSVWGGSLVMALGDIDGTTTPIIASPAGVTSIFAVRLGMDGVHGIAPEGGGIVSTYLPDLTAPGAVKTGEVEMVSAVAYKALRSAAVLRNIDIA